MKTTLYKLFLLMIIEGIMTITRVQAQFTAPSLSDVSYSAGTVLARNTGCDILEYGGDIYRVGVWEPTGTTQAFGWNVNLGGTTYTGTLPFTFSHVMGDPDVCLVVKSITNTVFAAVVYYDITSSEWYLEMFEFDPTSAQFITGPGPFMLSSGAFGTSINIDGNEHSDGEFTIVWDDSNGDIYTTVGDMASLVLYNNLYVTSGTHPDVSMYFDGSSDVVHMAFIDGSGFLEVRDFDFSDLVSGNSGTFSVPLSVFAAHNGIYSYPRIASPRGSVGSTIEWTVVVEEYLAGTPDEYYIVGYNNGNTTEIVYNDGSEFPWAGIPQAPNYYVSVCYDSNYPSDGIWVGWNFDHFGSTYTGLTGILVDAGYPIVLRCDEFGVPIPSSPITTEYLQVPLSITANNGDLSLCLSMAGRYGSDELFLTYNNVIINGSSADDICYKLIPSASSISSFRTLNHSGVYNIPKSDILEEEVVNLSIHNMEGRILVHQSLKMKDVQSFLGQIRDSLSSSMYLIKVEATEQGKFIYYRTFLGQ